MTRICRELSRSASQTYDLIIVGGGIYGVMLSFEASCRGLRSLLLEREDFGGATSYNSLRIIHGGFRYLQTLNLRRFFESVRERRWFLQTFPELVKPLPCLMPLYDRGMRRSQVLSAALRLNDVLSYNRNCNLRSDCHLPGGEILTAEQVKQCFPLVDSQGLQGGAVWHDASMPDSQRLLIALLRWSCALGGVALNYVEAQELLKTPRGIAGVLAKDLVSGEFYEYKAKAIVNAAGPWCRELAAHCDRDLPALFRSSLAWNVLFDRKALSDFALAVAPKKRGAKTYFLHPWKGRLLAGTVHTSWSDPITYHPQPTADQIANFIEELNESIPELSLSQDEVLGIFSGLLPATQSGSTKLSVREVILDHGKQGGCPGLYSVSGVKFTTSRLVAQKTLERILPAARKSTNLKSQRWVPPEEVQSRQGIFAYDWLPKQDDSTWKLELRKIIAEESVQHLDDLIFRRTSIGDNPNRALASAPLICQLFDWDDRRCHQEVSRLEKFKVFRLIAKP
jgi:glycerol-3-phosphate dehydrogenase